MAYGIFGIYKGKPPWYIWIASCIMIGIRFKIDFH